MFYRRLSFYNKTKRSRTKNAGKMCVFFRKQVGNPLTMPSLFIIIKANICSKTVDKTRSRDFERI